MNRKMVFDDDTCLVTSRVGASLRKRKLYSLTVEFSMIDFLILTIPPSMGLLRKLNYQLSCNWSLSNAKKNIVFHFDTLIRFFDVLTINDYDELWWT